MCRGCKIPLKDGYSQVDDYLKALDEYHAAIQHMKKADKMFSEYTFKIADRKQRKIVSRFQKQLVRIQKDYAKCEVILEDL